MEIDRSKLIYDLSMQCAAYIVSRYGVGATTVQSAMLDAFPVPSKCTSAWSLILWMQSLISCKLFRSDFLPGLLFAFFNL